MAMNKGRKKDNVAFTNTIPFVVNWNPWAERSILFPATIPKDSN